MSEVAIRSLIDQELEKQVPQDQQKLVDSGIYGHVLEELIASDVRGLSPILPGVERQPIAVGVIRYVEAEHVGKAQEVIRSAIQKVVEKGVGNFEWYPNF